MCAAVFAVFKYDQLKKKDQLATPLRATKAERAEREAARNTMLMEVNPLATAARRRGGGSAGTLDGCSGAYENANLVMYENTTLYRASTVSAAAAAAGVEAAGAAMVAATTKHAGGEGLAQQINPTYDVFNPVPPAYCSIPDDDVDDDGGGARAYSVINDACQDMYVR